MPLIRIPRAPTACAGVISLALLLPAAQLHAEPATTPPSASVSSTLTRARAAWDRGEFDVADTLYKEAVERGGLERADLLDAYVHMGACRAVLGRRAQATAAFRSAAVIDPKFATPAEVGKKTVAIAERARRDEAKNGLLDLSLAVPKSTPADRAMRVDAALDSAHMSAVAKVGVDARDPVSGASFASAQAPASEMRFELPARLSVGDATLVVRAYALDGHDNKLAVVEQRTRIEAAAVAPVVSVTNVAKIEPTRATASAPLAVSKGGENVVANDTGASHPSQHGFWSSPWPYLVGSLALAAGGAALYIGTRPTDDVTIGAVRVQAR